MSDALAATTEELNLERLDARPPERRITLRRVTPEGVYTVLGAGAGALGLVWVLYERVLPTSGAFGFWLSWYLCFLGLYFAAALMQWDREVAADGLVTTAVTSGALIVLGFFFDQVGYTIYRGLRAIVHANFYTDTMATTGPLEPLTSGGAVHAMVGTLEQIALATLITVPLALLAALFMSEIGGRWARPVRVLVDAMSALPSILAGLFVLALLLQAFHGRRFGLAAAAALTVMMLPIVTRSAELVIRLVPDTLREASYALGASQFRTITAVVLPTARSGLTTAVVLGMARGIGETSPVLLTAGFTKDLNWNPLSGSQLNLPLYVWSYVQYPQATMISRAFGAALTLIVVVLALFVTARLIGGRPPGHVSRRQRRRIRRDDARMVAVEGES